MTKNNNTSSSIIEIAKLGILAACAGAITMAIINLQ